MEDRVSATGTTNANRRNKNLTLMKNAPFSPCISKINNTFIDNAEVRDCYCRRVLQNILLNTIAHIMNNMTQMLQVSKNSNIKYNIIHVKTKPKRIYQIAKLD